MKLIKVQPEHFIVVDNTNIDMGDFIFEVSNREITEANDEWNGEESNDEWKKIIYSTQPLDGVELISLSEVRELIGEVDVEKLAEKYISDKISDSFVFEWDIHLLIASYIDGYNQCLQDNKDKIYTDSDIRRVVLFSRAIHNDSLSSQQIFEEVMLHIRPKTQWNVQFVDGELRLI